MSSVPIWSHVYDPAYELFKEASNKWDKGEDQSGDEKFLQGCASMHKYYDQSKDPWYNKWSPVGIFFHLWSIDPCYEERVKKLHEQTQFAYDGYKYE